MLQNHHSKRVSFFGTTHKPSLSLSSSNFRTAMPKPKHFSHAIFALSSDETMAALKDLPDDASVFSFFPVSANPEITSLCPVPFQSQSAKVDPLQEELFIGAFLSRRKMFFGCANHAIIFSDPLIPPCMAMLTTGIMCILSGEIKRLTIISSADLRFLLSSGTPSESEKLVDLIERGVVNIYSSISNADLKV